jgi:hypothetical protein
LPRKKYKFLLLIIADENIRTCIYSNDRVHLFVGGGGGGGGGGWRGRRGRGGEGGYKQKKNALSYGDREQRKGLLVVLKSPQNNQFTGFCVFGLLKAEGWGVWGGSVTVGGVRGMCAL